MLESTRLPFGNTLVRKDLLWLTKSSDWEWASLPAVDSLRELISRGVSEKTNVQWNFIYKYLLIFIMYFWEISNFFLNFFKLTFFLKFQMIFHILIRVRLDLLHYHVRFDIRLNMKANFESMVPNKISKTLFILNKYTIFNLFFINKNKLCYFRQNNTKIIWK